MIFDLYWEKHKATSNVSDRNIMHFFRFPDLPLFFPKEDSWIPDNTATFAEILIANDK